MSRAKHTNEEYLILLAKLRQQAEWYDGGHGYLHGEAADAIEELIADGGLETPPELPVDPEVPIEQPPADDLEEPQFLPAPPEPAKSEHHSRAKRHHR